MQHLDDIYCCVTVYETQDLHPYSTFKYLSDVVTHVYPIGNRTFILFFWDLHTRTRDKWFLHSAFYTLKQQPRLCANELWSILLKYLSLF